MPVKMCYSVGMAKKEQSVYSVSQVHSLIRGALESSMPPQFTVEAEVSQWTLHRGSGHAYFTLKDEKSVLSCVIWASNLKKVNFEPKTGQVIQAKGYVDVYPPQGRLQFYAEKLSLGGVGSLQAAFAEMVAKLEQQGLFKDEHKKPLPPYPTRIGLITSEDGAAVNDVAQSLYSRWPCARIYLYPVRVQGEGAVEEIARAFEVLNRMRDELGLELLILARGGGSLEDLWAFNEEAVARAIFDSVLPVVSAVGHERDVTIADLVADKRASTPSKAGVEAVPDAVEVRKALDSMQKRLTLQLNSALALSKERLGALGSHYFFRDPLRVIEPKVRQLERLSDSLDRGAKDKLGDLRVQVDVFEKLISRKDPRSQLRDRAVELSELHGRLGHLVKRNLQQRQWNVEKLLEKLVISTRAKQKAHETILETLAQRLTALDPRAVLKRGYSITWKTGTNELVRKPEDVKPDEKISTQLAGDRQITSTVDKPAHKKPKTLFD